MDTVKKSSTFLLLSFLIFPGIAGASGQDLINSQLQNSSIVHLPAGTYVLTDSIILQSNSVLEGEPGTVITIPNNVGWPAWKPLISGIGKHNITIRNLEIYGNADNQNYVPVWYGHSGEEGAKRWGQGYHNFIHLINCDSVTVNNCLMHDSLGDGLRTKYCKNVIFYNNVAYKLGHDCFYAIDSEGISAWNNTLTTRTNSGLRLWNSKDAQLFCNRINAQLDSLGGNPGIQIEDSKGMMDNVRVFANTIHETWGPGMWLISYNAGSDNYQNIKIDHNRIIKDGVSYNIDYTAGITIDGVQGTNISNNVFDGCNNAGVLVLDGGKDTKIEENIIANTREHPAISQSGTGCGIDNRRNAEIYILNNCFFNNANGNIFRAESVGDDLQDPTTHNTSSGWAWVGSGWLCDYVIAIENYTIGNSTFENETFENITCGNITCENITNNTGANDTDLHEIIFVPVNNTCPLKNAMKNVTECNKSKFKCPNIYDVPLIASITGCANKMKIVSCTAVKQSSVSGSGASTCEDVQLKLKIIDNSQSETCSKCDSDRSTAGSQNQDVNSGGSGSCSSGGGTSSSDKTDKLLGTGGSSGQGETVTPTPMPILPVPGFTTYPVSGSGSVPLVVNFHSTAQNAVTTKWDFGDIVDNRAAGTNVSHTYSAVGTYIVTQTVTNPNGTLTTSAQINVNRLLTPAVADFIATPVSGSAPLRVSFTDKSLYTAMPGSTVMYDFGGSEGTSSERNTSHVYNVPGTYYATQTVTNPDSPAGGSTKKVVITVNEVPVALAANFNANRISGDAPLSVKFTDASTSATTYAWDFGDHVGTSTEQNPSYVFNTAGSYDVVLTVSDGKGHSASKHMPITVTQAPPITPTQLVADFDADRTSGVDSLNVQFTDKSTGAVSWQWDFGDNSPIVTTRNAEHTFGVGNWKVNLKVSDGTNFASKTMTINVTEKLVAPIADFTADRIAGESPLTVQFSDKSKNAVSYEWVFGDGNTSTDKSPNYTYIAEGDYTVTLTVTGSSGDKSTSQTIISVSKPQPSNAVINDLNANATPLNSS